MNRGGQVVVSLFPLQRKLEYEMQRQYFKAVFLKKKKKKTSTLAGSCSMQSHHVNAASVFPVLRHWERKHQTILSSSLISCFGVLERDAELMCCGRPWPLTSVWWDASKSRTPNRKAKGEEKWTSKFVIWQKASVVCHPSRPSISLRLCHLAQLHVI